MLDTCCCFNLNYHRALDLSIVQLMGWGSPKPFKLCTFNKAGEQHGVLHLYTWREEWEVTPIAAKLIIFLSPSLYFLQHPPPLPTVLHWGLRVFECDLQTMSVSQQMQKKGEISWKWNVLHSFHWLRNFISPSKCTKWPQPYMMTFSLHWYQKYI